MSVAMFFFGVRRYSAAVVFRCGHKKSTSLTTKRLCDEIVPVLGRAGATYTGKSRVRALLTVRRQGSWCPMAKKKPKPDAIWEVLPVGEMRRKYGLYAENRPVIQLDPKRVPEQLRELIPLAEKFGISDDLIREDFFAKTPKSELAKLKRTLAQHDDLLDEWLAGPEADGPAFSGEYIAFSAMRMGVDCM